MKSKVIYFILFTLLCSTSLFSQNKAVIGSFFYYGKPSELEIKRQILFENSRKLVDMNEMLARTIAYYHYDAILKVNNHSIKNKPNITDIEFIKFALGQQVVDNILGDLQSQETEIQKLKTYLLKFLDIATVSKVTYKAMINIDSLQYYVDYYNNVFENFNVTIFIDTTDLYDDIHIIPNGENIDTIKMKNNILKEIDEQWIGTHGKIAKAFTVKGISVKPLNQDYLIHQNSNIIEFGSGIEGKIQQKAFYSDADYYVIVTVDRLTFEASQRGNEDSARWKISDADIYFKLYNVSTNEEITEIRVTNSYEYWSSVKGLKGVGSYRDPFTDLTYIDIIPNLAMMSVQLSDVKTFQTFFDEFYRNVGKYTPKGQNRGYNLRLLIKAVPQFTASDISNIIEKIKQDSSYIEECRKYNIDPSKDFRVSDLENRSYSNGNDSTTTDYYYIELTQCKLPIVFMKTKIKKYIENYSKVKYKIIPSPNFFEFIIYSESDDCCNIFKSNKIVEFQPELCFSNFSWPTNIDTNYVDFMDLQGNPVNLKRVLKMGNKIRIILDEELQVGKEYTIIFSDDNYLECTYKGN